MIWWFSFPDIYPVSGFFPDFSGFSLNVQIFLWIHGLILTNDMTILFSGNLSSFHKIFRIFSGFSSNNYISSQNRWFTSQIWYDNFPLWKFIRLPDFFPDFFRIFIKSSYFFTEWWFSFPKMYPVSGFFSGFSSNLHIYYFVYLAHEVGL